MYLVIVESPAKSKTISKFLGPEYQVLSSYGHIRDLPKSELGIDVENNFKPRYIIIPKARKNINILKKEAEKSEKIILSTDPDREGEAIAWHLSQILNLNGKPYQRIVFHEITKSAIEEALKNPKEIDINLVNAQQTRRILDRIVGYKLSPLLWKKIARGLSAGRVQSVAVKLVVEREREIKSFIAQEYWTIVATLLKIKNNEFEALLVKKDGEIIPKFGIKTKEETEEIVKDLEGAEYQVTNIEKKEIKRNPLPPFITSTLQQEAWKKFRWPAKFTMRIAQQLYETGKITYHRTDSLNLSDLSLGTAKKFIIKNYGENYYQFRKFKTKSKIAQEAHEAIRPTYPDKIPESLKLGGNQFKLYEMVWKRFIACQMSQARFDSTKVEIEAKIKNYGFQTNGSILKFDGFLKVYPIKYEETELPLLEKNKILELIKLISFQHFTQPPSRYSEATLIKTLEENGIGRPSTYAPILATIQERNYIEKDENKKFKPTEIGTIVNDFLKNHFPEIVDIGFTAKMEENLDTIAQGERGWVPIIKEFYEPFEKRLEQKYQEISKEDFFEKTDEICPKCNSLLIIRFGKYGKFYACPNFPKCDFSKPLPPKELGISCPKCKEGQIVEKITKKKKIFYGCSKWPKCDFAVWEKPLKENCPKCNFPLTQGKNKKIKCSNKNCDYEGN